MFKETLVFILIKMGQLKVPYLVGIWYIHVHVQNVCVKCTGIFHMPLLHVHCNPNHWHHMKSNLLKLDCEFDKFLYSWFFEQWNWSKFSLMLLTYLEKVALLEYSKKKNHFSHYDFFFNYQDVTNSDWPDCPLLMYMSMYNCISMYIHVLVQLYIKQGSLKVGPDLFMHLMTCFLLMKLNVTPMFCLLFILRNIECSRTFDLHMCYLPWLQASLLNRVI